MDSGGLSLVLGFDLGAAHGALGWGHVYPPMLCPGASLVTQTAVNLPAMRETQVRSLGWEVPLEKEMATHSSILPGKSHGQRSLAGCSPWGRKESDTTEQLHFLSFLSFFLPIWMPDAARFASSL